MIIGAVVFVPLLLTVSCIPTSPEYIVTFIISDGITGTPASGTYTYNEFESIPYSYTPTNPAYTWPEIFVNGSRASAKGNLKVYNNFTVEVRQIDIRNDLGNPNDVWEITPFNKYGGEEKSFELRFAGSSILSGSFSDNRGYFGTWTISESKGLTMTFTNWEDARFIGDISTMSGYWFISSYPDAYSWTSKRKN